MRGRILIIAGSDPSGGAGIQADIKTVTALGGYAATAITALTVQNTLGVTDVHEVPPSIIAAQIEAVLSDIGADAIKTGMLHNAEVIGVVAEALRGHAAPLILDPVMVAKGGHKLLLDDAIDALKTRLISRATLITPNIPEAEVLSGLTIRSRQDMEKVAVALQKEYGVSVLLKGGHLEGRNLVDILVTVSGMETIEYQHIDTPHTHGTGCTMASAIATFIAQGKPLPEAVRHAHAYVQAAIRTAPGFGQGHGPLNHTANHACTPEKDSV